MTCTYIPYKKPEPSSHKEKISLIYNKNYLICLVAFALTATVQFGQRILIALWIKTDRSDLGLGWETESNGGYMNSLSGLFIAGMPLVLSPYLSRTLGVKKTCMAILAGIIPAVISISWGYKLYGAPLWIFIVCMNGITISFMSIFISFISIAVSNSVPSNIAGAAMGICQSVGALGRTIANVGTATILVWSIESGLSFPFDTHFTFFLFGFLILLNIIGIKLFINDSVEKRKTKEIEMPLIEKNKIVN
jgi:MFS family permease